MEAIGKLRKVDVLAASGKIIANALQAAELTEVTLKPWRTQWRGLILIAVLWFFGAIAVKIFRQGSVRSARDSRR